MRAKRRAMGVPASPGLSQPILKIAGEEAQGSAPLADIADNQRQGRFVFDWLGAGSYKVDYKSGSMHGMRALVKEVHYGGDVATAPEFLTPAANRK